MIRGFYKVCRKISLKWSKKPVILLRSRGRSSIGRAPALQAGGCRFDPDRLHSLHTTDLGRDAKVRNWLKFVVLAVNASTSYGIAKRTILPQIT